jgi:membrane-associated phospholipid phosphatase
MAATTGYLRMYNNKHWFGDVVAGAGVGILSAKFSYWLFEKLNNNNKFHHKKFLF